MLLYSIKRGVELRYFYLRVFTVLFIFIEADLIVVGKSMYNNICCIATKDGKAIIIINLISIPPAS